MAPAQQRLDTQHASVGGVDGGLVVQHELVARHGEAQAGRDVQALHDPGRDLRREEAAAVAAFLLREIHRGVGLSQQEVGGDAVTREAADADAGEHGQLVAVDDDRSADRLDELGRDGGGRGVVLDVVEHDRELVAAEPRDDVEFAQAVAQALRGLDEHAVADLVAEGVVHRLEMVEVDEQQRDAAPLPAGAPDHVAGPLEVQRAVGQTREVVVVREEVHPLGVAFLAGDVGEDEDDAVGVAVGFAHDARTDPRGIRRARLAAVGDPAFPVAAFADALDEAGRLAEPVQAAHLAQRLVRRVTGDAAEGRVDPQDVPVGVDDQDALGHVVERASHETQALVGAALFRDVDVRADEAQRAAVLVAFHHLRAGRDPAVLATREPDAVLDLVVGNVALQRAQVAVAQRRVFLGGDERDEVVERDGDLAAGLAEEDRPVRVEVDALRRAVDVEQDLPGRLDRERETLLGLAHHRGLAPLAGDVAGDDDDLVRVVAGGRNGLDGTVDQPDAVLALEPQFRVAARAGIEGLAEHRPQAVEVVGVHLAEARSRHRDVAAHEGPRERAAAVELAAVAIPDGDHVGHVVGDEPEHLGVGAKLGLGPFAFGELAAQRLRAVGHATFERVAHLAKLGVRARQRMHEIGL